MSCIIPNGYKNKGGYSTSFFEGSTRLGHRVAYCLHHGLSYSDINGMVIRHTCDNPPCINPDHLILGTQLENIQDRVDRNRTASKKGTLNGRHKLSEAEVASIRSEYSSGDITQVELGRKYNVSNQLISMIVNKLVWTNVC